MTSLFVCVVDNATVKLHDIDYKICFMSLTVPQYINTRRKSQDACRDHTMKMNRKKEYEGGDLHRLRTLCEMQTESEPPT